MTKKDYILIAEVLRDGVKARAVSDAETAQAIFTAHLMCARLQSENPRFDRAKFLDACGLGR